MPTSIFCQNFPLTISAVEELWQATLHYQNVSDQQVTIKCVSASEIKKLNIKYRGQSKTTNVLTFTYPKISEDTPIEHDLALCLEVATQEASLRKVPLREYVALLLVHGFLHATGLDHENSPADASAQKKAEQSILSKKGYTGISL